MESEAFLKIKEFIETDRKKLFKECVQNQDVERSIVHTCINYINDFLDSDDIYDCIDIEEKLFDNIFRGEDWMISDRIWETFASETLCLFTDVFGSKLCNSLTYDEEEKLLSLLTEPYSDDAVTYIMETISPEAEKKISNAIEGKNYEVEARIEQEEREAKENKAYFDREFARSRF